jgi:hypothetical protein
MILSLGIVVSLLGTGNWEPEPNFDQFEFPGSRFPYQVISKSW